MIERQPFRFSDEAITVLYKATLAKAVAAGASKQPFSFAVEFLTAVEREMVERGDRPEPWLGILIDNYTSLRKHADHLADTLHEMVERGKMACWDTEDFEYVLEAYYGSYQPE